MIKADENRVNIRFSPAPMGKLLFQKKSDFIRLLSAFIRGKCRF